MSNVIYLGVFLDEPSKAKLTAWMHRSTAGPGPNEGGLLENVFAHHMTVAFKPDAATIEAFPFKSHCSLKVIGWSANEKAQAVLVTPTCAFPVKVDNEHPHITVATAEGVKPFYSNQLIREGWTAGIHIGLTVGGYCGWFDGKEVHYEAPVAEPDLAKLSEALK